jgi:hypothetical protein
MHIWSWSRIHPPVQLSELAMESSTDLEGNPIIRHTLCTVLIHQLQL